MIEHKNIVVYIGNEGSYHPDFFFMGFKDNTFGLRWPFYIKNEYLKRYFSGNKEDIEVEDNREKEEESYIHIINELSIPIEEVDMDELMSWYKS